MNDLQVFNYGECVVRTLMIDGAPWWVLKDICHVLNLKETHRVAARLDEDELTVAKVHSGGQNRKMNIINESGLYSVILRSDKPEAKAFKHWITHEVLPSIRKTGSYITPAMEKCYIPLAPPPMSVENQLRRAELLLHAAEFKTHNRDEQQSLVDLAVQDLIGNSVVDKPVSFPNTVRPISEEEDLMALPERIGVIKNAGMKLCGGIIVPLYTSLEIADIAGVTVAEFDRLADKHKLKTPSNGEWARVSTPRGNAREFLYTIDAVKALRKEVK